VKKRGIEKPRNAPPEKSPNGTMVKETNHMARKFIFIGVNDLIDGDGSSFNNTEVRI